MPIRKTSLLFVLLVSGCAVFSPYATSTFNAAMPYKQTLDLLNSRLNQCIVRKPTFYRVGFSVDASNFDNEAILQILINSGQGEQPQVAMIYISKQSPHQTTLTVQESTYGLGRSLHLTKWVNRWLHGDTRCMKV